MEVLYRKFKKRGVDTMTRSNRNHTGLIQSFQELMSLLHIHNPPEEWDNNWEKALAFYEGEHQLYFLKNEYFSEANLFFKLNKEKSDAFYNALELIRGRRDLTTLAWLWKYLLYEKTNPLEANDVASWPVPKDAMGTSVNMFPIIVVVSNLPWLIEHYKERSISNTILIDTLSDIGINMGESRNKTGLWGIENDHLGWLLNHFHGRIFRIGRLQFAAKEYDQSAIVCRHKKSGKVVALEGPLVEIADFFEGRPITPQGEVLPQPVKLSISEWEVALNQGDFLLDVHIPRGSKLDYEQLLESYLSAIEINPKLFPKHQFKGFICHTWIFDPILQSILPGTSNLVKFQKDYYLYRIVNDDSIFTTVFVNKPEDLNALPEETSLQRAIKEHVLSGNQMRSAAGFLLFEDFQKGSAYYKEKQGTVQAILE